MQAGSPKQAHPRHLPFASMTFNSLDAGGCTLCWVGVRHMFSWQLQNLIEELSLGEC